MAGALATRRWPLDPPPLSAGDEKPTFRGRSGPVAPGTGAAHRGGMTTPSRLSAPALASLAGTALGLAGLATAFVWGAGSQWQGDHAETGADVPKPAAVETPIEAAGFPTDEEIAKNWPRFRGPGASGIAEGHAMPVSWKGTLQQYAGRLHREHASKTDVRIIDFVDAGHPALLRMWDKRRKRPANPS